MFALTVVAILFALSLVVRGFWCRYLCPYGGLLGILGMFSPTRIVRNPKSCIDCSACTHACPAFIKVESVSGEKEAPNLEIQMGGGAADCLLGQSAGF